MEAWRQVAYPDAAYRDTVRTAWWDRFERRESSVGWEPTEETITCKDGSVRLVSLHGTYADGLQLIVFVDLTDSKRVEWERRRLWQAVEQSPVTVVITDLQGAIEYVNPAFDRSTGYAAAEAIGRKTSILKSNVHAAAVYEDLWRTITSGAVWHGERRRRRTGPRAPSSPTSRTRSGPL